ncbi:MAG: TOBE domain-containing protein, partial [Gemmatimonadota bacterium]
VYVTHDQVEAMTLGDRIVVLADGRIQQVGPPIELYRAPANRFVAGFIGTPPMNFLDGSIREEDGRMFFAAEEIRVELGRERATAADVGGGQVTLGVRPEDVAVHVSAEAVAGDASTGLVVLVERLGGTSHVHIEVGSHRLLALVPGESLPDVGARVSLRLRVDRVHVFGADGRVLHPQAGSAQLD